MMSPLGLSPLRLSLISILLEFVKETNGIRMPLDELRKLKNDEAESPSSKPIVELRNFIESGFNLKVTSEASRIVPELNESSI